MKYRIAALAVGASIIAGAGTAHADGMYSAKDAIAAPCCVSNWSGIYIGAAVGYGLARSSTTYQVDSVEWTGDPDLGQNPATQFYGDTSADTSSDGVTGTVTIGYDRDIGRNIVLGVFADYTFGKLDGEFISEYQQTIDSMPFGASSDISFENQWAIGARLGLARSCCTLWYLTAGYTQVDLDVSDNRARNVSAGELPIGGRSKTLGGYFLGAGLEQNLMGGLSLKLEYRFSGFSHENIYDVTQNFQCDTANCTESNIKRRETLGIDPDIHSIRLGLAYKFGSREPAAIEPLK